MRLWLSRQSEVPIREQLVTQVRLGVLSQDLAPGQRLPSTRELARRFKVHANTVSAAYRRLEDDGWLESRHGSGVYVKRNPPTAKPGTEAVDLAIAGLFRTARESGMPLRALRAKLSEWLTMQPPERLLLIEPEAELARIVTAEIAAATRLPVSFVDLAACSQPETLSGAVLLCLPSKTKVVRSHLPANCECITLQVRSAPASLLKWLPAKKELLVGVASRWTGFLEVARTILVAAGFAEDSLVCRNARRPGWAKGLLQTAAVVCDSLTGTELPKGCRPIPFPLLTEASLDELRAYEKFALDPPAERSAKKKPANH